MLGLNLRENLCNESSAFCSIITTTNSDYSPAMFARKHGDRAMFITKEEYIQLATTQEQFDGVSGDDIFDAANEAATSIIVDASGVTDPGEDSDDASDTLKLCAAWIVSYIVFTPARTPSVSADMFAENRARYEEALALLRAMRKQADVARTSGYSFNSLVEY